ncbi:hypothetical protein SASPL_141106 [Salvia splendens]|uniref:DDE Tnp4 domain-containing protein n=1 Tax=Salvia splendens TaxID=180675 RepID=A0A8X8WRJ9_SALSN|nr:hypothetical protein SASPL_141106 [Salvia splendens]
MRSIPYYAIPIKSTDRRKHNFSDTLLLLHYTFMPLQVLLSPPEFGEDELQIESSADQLFGVDSKGDSHLNSSILLTESIMSDQALIRKGCLGALDKTYINVRIHLADISRYRNRKGQITTNTLVVCDQHLQFVYVLPGWEGSAGDSRILRDAINRPLGLQVPKCMTVVAKFFKVTM